MSRSFRVYQKKRGHRRTGSGALARLGEALFFAFFLLIGCGGLVAILTMRIIPEWRVNNKFVETTCVVRAKELAQQKDGDGYRPDISIDYTVAGKLRSTKTYDICRAYSNDREAMAAAAEQFEVGGQYRCWYDPAHPETVVLIRGYTWWTGLLLVVPISFILIGGGGVLYRALYWGKSAEHRAATTVTIPLRPRDGDGHPGKAFPTVPPLADMTNSPGTTLRFRLPVSGSTTAGLIVLLSTAICWNAVVAYFLIDAINGFLAATPNWVETGVVVPFLLVGLLLIFVFFRQLLVATGVGPTLLEISDHPLYPSRRYELFLSQAGRLRLHSLELSLVATEEVRYRQGTDTRTERRCVHRQSLFRRDDFEIRGGIPLEVRCELDVPAGIMHSFKSDNNSLAWSLVVEGKVAGWPDYRRAFPVVVYPETQESKPE